LWKRSWIEVQEAVVVEAVVVKADEVNQHLIEAVVVEADEVNQHLMYQLLRWSLA
jgi:hypothetical protein